ncbi:hypothetical protein ACLOJK_008006 [Asimina triloba]
MYAHMPRHSGWERSQIMLVLRVEDDPLVQQQTVSLSRTKAQCNEHQGWMYVQVGDFLCRAAMGEVEFRIHEPEVKEIKTGILVAGVQICPCSSDEETGEHQPKRKNPKLEKRIAN